jgi:hypothetical protein
MSRIKYSLVVGHWDFFIPTSIREPGARILRANAFAEMELD